LAQGRFGMHDRQIVHDAVPRQPPMVSEAEFWQWEE
jgi:hypothetical protein